MKEDWLLWMISDSALPTGGFVASCGLEAAVQLGHVVGTPDSSSLRQFIQSFIHTTLSTHIPFIHRTFQSLQRLLSEQMKCGEGASDAPQLIAGIVDGIVEIDKDMDSFMMSNHVASRASTAQGIAYINLLANSFTEAIGPLNARLGIEFKQRIRSDLTPGHLAVSFAFFCFCFSISEGNKKKKKKKLCHCC